MENQLSNEPDFRLTDYKDMVFPLHQFSKGDEILSSFPIFSMYRVFFAQLPEGLTMEKVLLYISYCFDKGSPFVKKYNDIVERRFWAAVQAGFKLNQRHRSFNQDVENMIRGKVRAVNNMIIQYVLLQGDEDYSIFVAYNEALKQQLTLLLNLDTIDIENDKGGTSVKDIKTITENVSGLRKEIAEIRMKMFFSVEDKLLNQSLYDFMEAGNLRISPESYAEKKVTSQATFRDEEGEKEKENGWGVQDIYTEA